MKKNQINKSDAPTRERVLGRQVARELSMDDLSKVTGGTTSCSGGRGDDCDFLR